MPDRVAPRRARPALPACARRALAARVEAQPGHGHEDVAGVRVDRDPLALAASSEARQAARVEGPVEQARARERERDGARAVVARVLPGAVAAAPLVGLRGDLVGRRDDERDNPRGALRQNRAPVLVDVGARALAGIEAVEMVAEGGELALDLGVGRRSRLRGARRTVGILDRGPGRAAAELPCAHADHVDRPRRRVGTALPALGAASAPHLVERHDLPRRRSAARGALEVR